MKPTARPDLPNRPPIALAGPLCTLRHVVVLGSAVPSMASGPVSALDLAKWTDVQHEIRSLALQRGLRFIAVAVLAPFGVSGLAREQDGGGALSSVVFGVALLFLAVAELASMAQAALRVRERSDLEKAHPALAPKGKPSRLARAFAVVSGPGFSTALYALLGAAFVVGASLPGL